MQYVIDDICGLTAHKNLSNLYFTTQLHTIVIRNQWQGYQDRIIEMIVIKAIYSLTYFLSRLWWLYINGYSHAENLLLNL